MKNIQYGSKNKKEDLTFFMSIFRSYGWFDFVFGQRKITSIENDMFRLRCNLC